MSFWRGETLAEKLPALIEPFNRGAIDCAAYTLHVGHQIYISPNQLTKDPDRQTRQELTRGQSFCIPPGQFAFLLTEETVTVPNDALALISIKGRIKFKGLINISGFHVDPGYNGQLMFSVLNVGPKPLHLTQGEALFLIWYADLDGSTTQAKKRKGFVGIESDLINGISGEILSLQSLTEKQRALESQVRGHSIRVNTLISIGVGLFLLLLGTVVGLVATTVGDHPQTTPKAEPALDRTATASAPK